MSKYRLAVHNTADNAQLWNNIGMCLCGKGKLVAAVSCLKRAAYLSQLDWRIAYNLALVHHALQQPASAFHFISSAINLQPNSAALFTTLGGMACKCACATVTAQ
jgi:Bardet-Biedl syndrome 4 protein